MNRQPWLFSSRSLTRSSSSERAVVADETLQAAVGDRAQGGLRVRERRGIDVAADGARKEQLVREEGLLLVQNGDADDRKDAVVVHRGRLGRYCHCFLLAPSGVSSIVVVR
jgi:hypothetical protein